MSRKRHVILQELYQKGKYSYSDIAVLYRVNQQSRALEEAMRENGQPYRIFGGMSFYQRKEIKDIISYLKVLVNPDDSISIKRIINCPPRNVGTTTVTRIENEARKKEMSLYGTMQHIVKSNGYTNSLKEKVNGFLSVIDELIASRDIELYKLLELIYEKTGYVEWVSEDRAVNLVELVEAAKGKTLRGFLDAASLFSGLDVQDSENSVSLMTLHSAKGLEFPVVFIAGLEDGLIPHFHAIKDPEELEEERRLFYVGITRAKDMLIMSGAKKRRLYTSVQEQQPSRFLSDIPAGCYKCIVKRPRADAISSSVVKRSVSLMSSSPFATGARVKHPTWGVGVVRDSYGETDDVKVMVNFPTVGIKRLSLKHANLEKI
jgi:DNA helicase-2/ATP-dependent DNA helicase PcrA